MTRATRRVARGAAGVVCVAGALLVAAIPAARSPLAAAEDERRAPGPLITKWCASCHKGSAPDGDLDLTPFTDDAKARATPGVLRTIRERLRTGDMPPPDAPQPPHEEREAVIAWIDGVAGTADEAPRVVLRRLSRVEYANCVRDLVGVEIAAESEFPADDLGYGFDTVGEVLSVSPALIERYAAVAKRIAEEAVIDADPADAKPQRFEAEKLRIADGANVREGRFVGMFSSSAQSFRFTAPRDGEYVLRARAFGDQAGDEPARITWSVGGRVVGTNDVPGVRAKPDVVETRTKLTRGTHEITAAFANDYYRPEAPAGERDRNLILDWYEVEGPVDEREPPPSHRRIFAADPGKGPDAARARAVLRPLASRAWRRPVADDELGRLVRLVTDATSKGRSFERGVRTALRAILVSPHFIYRVERAAAPSEGLQTPRPLDGHELAARLALYLWSSLPDDELTAAAARGDLSRPDALEAQARRMLRDPRASALATNFAAQWLELRNLGVVAPDPQRFPEFDEELRASMRRETESVFEAILREQRDVRELLDSDWTFLDERLAKHYGIDGVRGPWMRRVRLGDDRRGGVVTHASVLTVTSLPTRTSPVKRGKWVLDHILASPPPPPPPGADSFAGGEEALRNASIREQMERHRKDPACAVCHKQLDGIGLAFEHFDAVGRWRAKDGRFAIDTAGAFADGRKFADATELRRALAAGDAFPKALAKKLATYAIGRGMGSADAAAIDALVASFPADRRTLEDLVIGVVRLEAFRTRGADPAE